MKFVRFEVNGKEGLGLEIDGKIQGFTSDNPTFPGMLDDLLGESGAISKAATILADAPVVDGEVRRLPPLARPGKVLCVGLNYYDHTAESGYEQPDYPTMFIRFASNLIGDGDAIVRPDLSETLDFEGELVAVIGRRATKVSEEDALDYVAGYSIFNDGSIREYQHATPQWTIGKNFDDTGVFGPCFVPAADLPAGCLGLTLETRLNGKTVQKAKIDDMVFSVKKLVSLLSQTMALEPGDIIVTGTPSGVGAGRKPPLWMKPGDTIEVSIEKIGTLTNSVVAESERTAA